MKSSDRDFLCLDLLTEILKLPVKSIIRFNCVSKQWRHLFRNPDFVSRHFNIARKKKFLIVYYCEGTLDIPVVVMHLFVDQDLVAYRNMRRQLPPHFVNLFVFNFCVESGLICLFDRTKSRITISNPATREFKILPECNDGIPDKSYTFAHTLGFGLDPLSNDHKVVHIRSYVDEETNIQGPDHYAVYNMSTNSWRVIKHKESWLFECLGVCPNGSNACANGVYYWLTDYNILAFHLGREVFQLIESPCGGSFGRLLPLNDRISFWDTEMMDKSARTNEVWILNDESRWTKLLKIEPSPDFEKMFGFWKYGEVLAESATGEFVLCDLETHNSRQLGIKTRVRGDLLQVYTYEENLVSIKRD
ncbi:hypothetical protein F3Y22_tig00112114pilonHSYRG00169 [Hibiscus syriacus]|uniref:F-box domain-containing protein n=1 Tax=Hibiscus syriacus TaxID=106335 RepID=A0A6A2YCH0_HIBSY|nr:putative F-box protein At1g32420 [Hibiscus syriacus]KAE8670697.1 hypothetical protein F3Y22_tig00112114pilonHSYRG00169 [Hibiscus syriacus]